MLSLAVTFLLVAIFAAIFGFVVAGPAGFVVFIVFFAAFLWALVTHLTRGRNRDDKP